MQSGCPEPHRALDVVVLRESVQRCTRL